MSGFAGRLGFQQRVLPSYRKAFFEALAAACPGGMSLFAGQPLPVEGIASLEKVKGAQLVLGTNRHFRDPSSAWYLCWQGGLLQWLEEWQPQALVVEANPRYLTTRLAIRWMQARRRPVIGWGLGAPPLSGAMAFLRRWERLSLLGSLDRLIAYSRRGAEEYRQLGLPAERISVASNAVLPPPSGELPKRPEQTGGRASVLFVGRLQARKRVDTLLQACAALPEALQPRLVVIGDGPARAEFESLARQIYPRAEFPGALHGAALEPFYTEADLFVLPGTGGLAVQQAMAHGLPVIVAQGDGTQEDLVRPGNGWQVTPGDAQGLSRAIRAALADIPHLRRMGAESYRIVQQEINIQAMVKVFLSALDEVDA